MIFLIFRNLAIHNSPLNGNLRCNHLCYTLCYPTLSRHALTRGNTHYTLMNIKIRLITYPGQPTPGLGTAKAAYPSPT